MMSRTWRTTCGSCVLALVVLLLTAMNGGFVVAAPPPQPEEFPVLPECADGVALAEIGRRVKDFYDNEPKKSYSCAREGWRRSEDATGLGFLFNAGFVAHRKLKALELALALFTCLREKADGVGDAQMRGEAEAESNRLEFVGVVPPKIDCKTLLPPPPPAPSVTEVKPAHPGPVTEVKPASPEPVTVAKPAPPGPVTGVKPAPPGPHPGPTIDPPPSPPPIVPREDPAFIGLMVTGTLVALAGGGMLVGSLVVRDEVADGRVPAHDERQADIQLYQGLFIGAGALPVGVALMLGGFGRLGVVRKRVGGEKSVAAPAAQFIVHPLGVLSLKF